MDQVNTKKVKRRPLRLNSVVDLFNEADRLAAAERAGRLTRAGNWTLGQAFGHIAGWANTAYEGYPPQMPTPPWIVKVLFKLLKSRFLNKGFPQGVRMRGTPEGTLFAEPHSLDDGLARLRQVFTRIKSNAPTHQNAIFGTLTREELEQLNLRHAELHLGFFDVR